MKREQQQHRDAWNTYFQLRQQGLSKSQAVMTVSRKHNVSETTVWRWKKRFRWDERESVRVSEVNRKVEERLNEQLADFKAQYLGLLNDMIFQVIDERESGCESSLQITSVLDLERVMKLALLIQGESTERVEEDVKGDYDPELIRKIGRKLIQERRKGQDTGT
ncbi:MAG TPA: hypothetical protein PKY84_05415 [Thermosynergistes sp.]|nr:hypothetical protein [Thermosynergistes sp.]